MEPGSPTGLKSDLSFRAASDGEAGSLALTESRSPTRLPVSRCRPHSGAAFLFIINYRINSSLSTASTAVKTDIARFINDRLGQYDEVEKIFIEQKSDDVFEVVVITKKISPNFEKSLIELEDTVQEKYHIPSYFKTFSNASTAAMLLTQ